MHPTQTPLKNHRHNMGYENLYRIGRGAAQVWQGNPGLSYLQQSFEQDQKRRDKEDADMQAELSKMNFSGVKVADMDYFNNKYKEVKNYQARISNSTSKDERMKLRSEMDLAKQRVMSEVEQSKAENQLGVEVGKLRITKPDDLSDTFVDDFKKWNSLSTFDPSYKDFTSKFTGTMLAPSFDITKFNDGILDKSVKPITPTEKQKRSGSYTYLEKTEGTELDPNLVYKNLELAATNDKKVLRAIMRSYPNAKPEEAVKMAADQLVKDNKEAYRKVKTQELGGQHDIRPSWSDLYGSYSDRHPDAATPSSYDVTTKTYRTDDGKINEKSTVHNFVTVSGNKSFAPTQLQNVYNLNNGKNESFSPSGDKLTITGVGEIVAKGGIRQRRVTVVDKDGQEYAFREQDIPVEIRASKGYKASIEASQKASQGTKTKKVDNSATSGNKVVSYSQAQEKGIEAVIKRSGASREQVIEALKAAGKLK